MGKERLGAFSDGVIAIIITIMVLELKVPHGADLAALRPLLPVFLSYAAELRLRRHLLEQPSPHAACHRAGERRGVVGQHAPAVLAVADSVRDRLDGREPFRGRARQRCTALCCWRRALAYWMLQRTILAAGAGLACWRRRSAATSRASCRLVLYVARHRLCLRQPWIADGFYVLVALMWLLPDPRIERLVSNEAPQELSERGSL